MHTLKILEQDDETAIVGGYGVVFGGEDLEGETFAADTDFMLDLVPVKPVYIDHAGDSFVTADGKTIKLVGVNESVGTVTEVTADDVGLYMKLQLEKAGRYWSVVEQMIGTGKAGLSSGTVGHLARRNGKAITRWPIVEESITLTPAEPRTVGVDRLKALAELNPGLKALIPEADGTSAADGAMDGVKMAESLDAQRTRIVEAFLKQFPKPPASYDEYVDWWVVEVFDDHLVARLLREYWQIDFTDDGRTVEFAARDAWVLVEERREWVEAVKSLRATRPRKSIEFTEDGEMADTQQAQDKADLKTKVDALSESVNKIIEVLEKSPAMKSAGYTTDDGGTADASHKSFGDFLLAVKRGDTKRLATVYGSKRDDGETKDVAGTAGATGGYLVPTEHLTPLLKMAEAQSMIYSRVQKVPVARDAGEWPALDQYMTPTAGSGETALAGGVKAKTKAAGATLDETEPLFKNVEWRIHKIGGYVEVHNEMVSDSPESIEALLRGLFGIAVAAKNERNILRGSGVGEPLGILNAPAAIGVTPGSDNAFSYTDALNMRSRFKMAGGSPVWLIHPGIWPDLGAFETTSGGGVWAANLAAGMPQGLLGYPIIESEHLPQDDNAGAVILADLNAYLLFERQQLSIAFSEHAAFTSDKGTWRFTVRNDGQPWLKSAVTLADPQGSYTVSPFVYHND